MKTPVTRHRVWVVEVSWHGSKCLGEHGPLNFYNRQAGRIDPMCIYGAPAASFFRTKGQAQTAIRRSERWCRARKEKCSFRVLTVVIEVPMRERPMVGYVPQEAMERYRLIKPRTPRRKKTWRKKDLS